MARVLFVTDQWGYGTTTSAISIAAALEGLDDTRWFISEGAGYTLAKRSPLEEFIPANTMAANPPEPLKEAVRESDVVVSVMNPNAALVADRLCKPCVYVDMLLWMWDRPPVLPPSVTRYFAEGFTGVGCSLGKWRDQLPKSEVVGPLIAPATPLNPNKQTDVLVNFGGLSSWLMPPDSLITYARTMVECVVEALAEWRGMITISAGEHVLNTMDDLIARLTPRGVRFVNLSQSEYLQALERSRLLVSSPGLHATQEAFARGIPCLFLPSQNLSQVLALRKLNKVGAALALDWDSMYGVTDLSARDEHRSCLRIADCIRRFKRDVLVRGRLIWHLTAQLAPGFLERLAAAQAGFFEPYRTEFGENRVAAYVRHLVSPSGPRLSIAARAASSNVDQAVHVRHFAPPVVGRDHVDQLRAPGRDLHRQLKLSVMELPEVSWSRIAANGHATMLAQKADSAAEVERDGSVSSREPADERDELERNHQAAVAGPASET